DHRLFRIWKCHGTAGKSILRGEMTRREAGVGGESLDLVGFPLPGKYISTESRRKLPLSGGFKPPAVGPLPLIKGNLHTPHLAWKRKIANTHCAHGIVHIAAKSVK